MDWLLERLEREVNALKDENIRKGKKLAIALKEVRKLKAALKAGGEASE